MTSPKLSKIKRVNKLQALISEKAIKNEIEITQLSF